MWFLFLSLQNGIVRILARIAPYYQLFLPTFFTQIAPYNRPYAYHIKLLEPSIKSYDHFIVFGQIVSTLMIFLLLLWAPTHSYYCFSIVFSFSFFIFRSFFSFLIFHFLPYVFHFSFFICVYHFSFIVFSFSLFVFHFSI